MGRSRGKIISNYAKERDERKTLSVERMACLEYGQQRHTHMLFMTTKTAQMEHSHVLQWNKIISPLLNYKVSKYTDENVPGKINKEEPTSTYSLVN